MVEHCAARSPGLAAEVGRAQLVAMVRAAIARAAGHGFTLRGPVRLYLELGLLFGSDFDERCPWAQAWLAPPEAGEPDPINAQMDRATALHQASLEALAGDTTNMEPGT